jgi:hypothetical protein
MARRLPELGRQTVDVLSVGERVMLSMLRGLRSLVVAGLAGAVVLWATSPDWTGSGLGRVAVSVARNPLPVLGLGTILLLTLNSLVRKIADR